MNMRGHPSSVWEQRRFIREDLTERVVPEMNLEGQRGIRKGNARMSE